MTRIFLVRHGQTAWNVGEIFRGRADVPLDETGLKEADLAGEALKDETIHAIYSSPLKRSVQTAEGIAKYQKLPVQTLEAIIDISYGEWEGKENAEVKQKYPDLYKLWLTEPHKVRFPGGETLDEVRTRTMSAIEKLVKKHQDESIVLVAHRVPNKVISCAVLGLDNSHFWRIKQDTASTNLFIYDNDQWIIAYLNNTFYLKVLGKPALSDF